MNGEPGWPRWRLRRRPGEASAARRAGVWTVGAVVTGAVVLGGGYVVRVAAEHHGTPSCSWPLRVRGHATPEQAGLVRCYLRALAGHDTGGLLAVAAYDPAVRITPADLAHSADARAGLATATFTPNLVDSASVFVAFAYADGARDTQELINMIAMGDPDGWRLVIGTIVNPGPSIPPAVISPSDQ